MLIALSGYSSEEARYRSAEAGFDLHLAKPPDLVLLTAALAGAKRSSSDRDEPARSEIPGA
jgi:hypothetical protein